MGRLNMYMFPIPIGVRGTSCPFVPCGDGCAFKQIICKCKGARIY